MASLDAGQTHFAAVNRAGIRIPQPILWWVTYHPDAFYHESWNMQRQFNGGNSNYTVVSHNRHIGLERAGLICRQVSGPSCTGSSALLAVLFGLAQGYPLVILAGAPMEAPDYHKYRVGWENEAKHLAGRVRSLSGWTKSFLEAL